MYRSTIRATSGTAARVAPKRAVAGGRRFVSTAPPHQKSRSWKSSAARWGLAGTLVYYYNTNNVFAEEPYTIHAPPETSRETETLPTIEAVAEHRRQQALAQAQSSPSPQSAIGVGGADAAGAPPGSPEGLEEEASQEGAFNEETGEINWDCPCLGGMAHGPCGEQFKAAFSCFVYSKEEPKGVDCIENFKNMQNCFREHPDMYGAELEPDEEMPPQQDQPVPGEQPGSTPAPAPAAAASTAPSRGEKVADHTNGGPDSEKAVAEKRQRAIAATEQVKGSHTELSETETAVPKAWHDSR